MDTKKIWPAANEKGLGWTERYPRPTAENGHHPGVLATRQAEWDAAEDLRQKYAKRSADIAARREAEIEAKRVTTATAADAKREAQRADLESMLRKRFIAAGGSEAEWEQEKSQIVAEHRRRAVANDSSEQAAQRAQSALYSRF